MMCFQPTSFAHWLKLFRLVRTVRVEPSAETAETAGLRPNNDLLLIVLPPLVTEFV